VNQHVLYTQWEKNAWPEWRERVKYSAAKSDIGLRAGEREGCFIYEAAWDDDDIIITLNSKKSTHTYTSPKTHIRIHSAGLLLLRDKILCRSTRP
jgi:hypothetical protein